MLRTLFVCAILGVGTIAAFRSRFAGLLLYLWFGFFRPQEWVWFDLTAAHASLVLGILLVVPSILGGILPNLTHPLSVGSVMFFAVALLSQFGAVQPDIGWAWLDYLGRLLLVSLLTISIVRTRRQFFLTVAVVAGSLGFHTAKAGLASILAGGVRFSDGLAGPWIDNNGYALAGTMVMFPLIAVGQNTPQRSVRWACYAAAFLTVGTVVSTFSREGFLGLVAGTITFLLFQRRRVLSIVTFTVLAGLFISVVPLPEGYADRLHSIQTYEETGDSSALSRFHFWRVAADMALDKPFGVGLRNFEAAFDKYDFLDGKFGRQRSVHSSHFQVLAETGILGACVWAGLLVGFYVVGLRIRSRARDTSFPDDDRFFCLTMSAALMASMAAFIVGGSFIALALNDLTWVTFALMATLDRVSRSMYPVSLSLPVERSFTSSAAAFINARSSRQ